MPSRSSRKRQARLTFTPVPSSSPVAKEYDPGIQDRLAAVRYDGSGSPSPAKRPKNLRNVSSQARSSPSKVSSPLKRQSSPLVMLPSPESHIHDTRDTRHRRTNGAGTQQTVSSDDDDPIQPTQSRANKVTRAKQQRIDFSRARDPDTFSSPVKLPSSSAALPQSSTTSAGMFSSQPRKRKRQSNFDASSESEGEVDLPSPRKLLKSGQRRQELSNETAELGGNGAKKSKKTTVVISDEDDDQGEEDEDNIVVSSGRPNPAASVSEDSEDEMPTTAGRQGRRKRQAVRDDFIASSATAEDSDDDLEIVLPSSSRKRNGFGGDAQEDNNEDDDDHDAPITPRRRTLKRANKRSRQEQEDLDDDLDFLEPSSDIESSARAPRSTQNTAKAKRQEALERLKRKRQANPPPDVDGDAAMDDARDELYDVSSQGEDEDGEDEHLPYQSGRQMFAADEEDEDFIDEDDADGMPLGVPEGVPLEFTRFAAAKPKELFKYAVEWMVQKKINPAFRMEDEIYELTFRKLNDEVRGLAGSKFKSAAWTPDFTTALTARPEISSVDIDRKTFFDDKCEACNRNGHVPTFTVQFLGKPYHPDTLEEVGDKDEDGDDDDGSSMDSADSNSDPAYKEEKTTYDYQGREVPAESTVYNVGRFCMANASTAHTLQHWRYHLNEWVVNWLNVQGYNTPEKIVQRDRWSTKKRRKYADKVVDRMEKEGEVRTLWQEFRKNIDEARTSKQVKFWRDGSP